ncbi:MAG: GNAT family N-acetyltransferase [Faecalibacillus sp.]
MEIREVTLNDLDTIYYLEKTCFLESEAASYDALKSRLEVFHQGYDILYVDQQPVGYIGGLKNDVLELPDEMYHDSSLHCSNGKYQAIFSVCILPQFQRKGYASIMVKNYIEKRKNQIEGFVLTCKDHLIPFYQSCGFSFEKVSKSTHGDAKWNDMILKV